MNLDNAPTIDQLRKLIRGCDDGAADHVLWIKKTGEVELSRVPKDQTPVGFQAAHPEMQVRFETFLAGNEYVGPEAAGDSEWMSELFDGLLKKWFQAKGKPEVEYVDMA